jgi:polygalacturonase
MYLGLLLLRLMHMKKTVIGIAFLISVLWVQAAPPVEIEITRYGAVGDGITRNTTAIQKAIDECHQQGGGKVVFPAGNWLSGTIVLKDQVILQFNKDARLLGSTDINDYQNMDPFTDGLGIDVGWALVVAVDAKNIGIEGEGAIDGQGSKLKEQQIATDTRPESQRWGRRPFFIRLVRCVKFKVKRIKNNYYAARSTH